jgi:Pyruvate/2-oxoacid:ferredoxin oxidoreductase delta subunit
MPIIRSSRLYRCSQCVAHDCKDETLESEANSVVVSAVLSCVGYAEQACVVYWVCRGGGVVAD